MRMYVSSTNSIVEVRNPSSSIVFKSSAIKNKNRIEEIEDPCEIFVLIVKVIILKIIHSNSFLKETIKIRIFL